MDIIVLGLNHKTAPVHIRERVAFPEKAIHEPLRALHGAPGVRETMILSTCNRVEIVAWARDPEAARLRLRSCFERELAADGQPVRPAELEAALYALADGTAIRHVLRVACSIDSLVVGEPQILGQVKDAYPAAVACGACGPILGRLYPRAFATAKRVKNVTRLAERPVSVARVAVDLARQIFESLATTSA